MSGTATSNGAVAVAVAQRAADHGTDEHDESGAGDDPRGAGEREAKRLRHVEDDEGLEGGERELPEGVGHEDACRSR
jgi:hypothetical protein